MKRSSSIIKNMPVSSDEVRAASAVDEVTTMNFVPTTAIGAESVAVQSIRRALSMRSNKEQPITEVTRDSPQEKGDVEQSDVTSEMKRNNDFYTFGKEEVRQVEGVTAESRAASHLETFDELEDDFSLEYSDNGSDYSI
jgi:hypothetical protein